MFLNKEKYVTHRLYLNKVIKCITVRRVLYLKGRHEIQETMVANFLKHGG